MSQSIQRILLATDFSAGAARAQGHAVAWAKKTGAHLDILHVLEFQPGMDTQLPVNKMYLDQVRTQADQHLDAVLKEIGESGVSGKIHIGVGIPSQEIIDAARKLDADIVILGTRGVTGLEHVLVGSTAERVVRGAPCPVLSVHLSPQQADKAPVEGQQAHISVHNILVAVDFSDCSLEALEYAILVAKAHEATLTVLHVLEPISFGLDFTLRHVEDRRQMRTRIEAWLSKMESVLTSQGLKASHRLDGGWPADSILSRTRQQPCDLIIMGTHGRRGFSHLIGGSVAESVLRHALCPVLTVKSPKFAHGHRRVLSEHKELLVSPVSSTKET